MIDLHSHVLFGIDDGPDELEGSVAICRAAAAEGTTVIAATPHVRRDHPTTPELMEDRLEEVRLAVGHLIRVVPGGEVALEELDRPQEELRRYALAGNPRYLLVETPYTGWPLDFADRIFRLAVTGVTAVVAHPERNAEAQNRPELLDPLLAAGALMQLTAASVEGRGGDRSKAMARLMIDRGLAHLIASDGHEASVRAVGLAGAAAAIGDDELARWLTVGVPGAIVDGTELPPRPARKARPRRSFLRR